ncbi:MAG: hypothetical protein JWN56_1917 [Sphingobacteriales bacterium]|nr:hypothetical protein [Sphingobacteriales bacterium]
MNFGNDKMFISRVKSAFNQKKHFTFLLGSGCTLANNPTEKGVSSVKEIINQIKSIFETDNQSDLIEEVFQIDDETQNHYQLAINTLLQSYGQDDVNKVIVNAVLNARSTSIVYSDQDSSNNDLEDIEKHIDGWEIKTGMDALGKLLVEYPKSFGSPVLTTNFDPLIEISVAKHKGHYNPTCLTNDGNILNNANTSIVQIIHLHGFWRHGDTLHSPYQLTKERPLLKGDLRKLLNNTVLVVLGYGGWGDVFTNTLIDVITEGGNDCNILWTFYENNSQKIEADHSSLFERLKNSLDQRVVLYKGIDFNEILPKMYDSIRAKYETSDKENTLNSAAESLKDDSQAIQTEEDNLKSSPTAYECDIPPSNSHWVGRENELQILKEGKYKACFITGIGGQGKSGLASHFLKSTSNTTDSYDFWDWRDCKEEDNRFITIFISLIERLTNGKYRSYQLINENINDIISLFFKELGSRKGVFVFDNIDNYIDLLNFYPSRGINEFLNVILTTEHNSKFIFTCRPEINSASPNLSQIQLKDLSLDETKELFITVNSSLSMQDKMLVAEQAHQLTNGHPLWLNLIAAQSGKGKNVALQFIEDIKNSKGSDIQSPSTILAVNTLNIVWKLLNAKQETLMRGIAETIVAETEKHLRDIISSELNDNQFNKAFNAIKKMNLVVVKTSDFASEQYELHPLVKEFIVYKYPKKDRKKYITMFVKFYDQVILLVKKAPDPYSPLSLFQNWTNKIELEINKENYEGALATLHEISSSILTAGYIEEYQRVATRFYIEVDFNEALHKEYSYFEEQLRTFTKTLSEIGKYSDAEAFLSKYSKGISVKGTQYLYLCETYSYHYWCKKDYKQSIEYAERALEIIKTSNISTGQDVSNNLALALRDTQEPENVRKALDIFTGSTKVEDLLNDIEIDHINGGAYYGNIGRCFWHLGNKEVAVKFYKRSYRSLLEEFYTNSIINKGFATCWVTEALVDLKRFNDAYFFYKLTLKYWTVVAPIKRIEFDKSFSRYFKDLPSKILNSTDWEIEKFCDKFCRVL